MKKKLLQKIKSHFRLQRVVQIYLGLFLLTNVAVGWLIPLADLKLPPASESFISELWQINLIMPMVKLIELISAVLFIFNRKTFFALLIFYPVLFNIICIGFHFFGGVNYSVGMIASVIYLTWDLRLKFIQLLRE